MPEFHFDLGNSHKGPIGMCAQTKAPGQRAALHKLREMLDEFGGEIELTKLLSPEAKKAFGDGYCCIFISPENIRFKQGRRTD